MGIGPKETTPAGNSATLTIDITWSSNIEYASW